LTKNNFINYNKQRLERKAFMKTSKGSTINLNPFRETISLIYNIDSQKELNRIEQESILFYYVSDIQYTILKRNLETELGKPLSFEEMNAILSKQNFRLKPQDLSLLTQEDISQINYDINRLGKYNELFDTLNCNELVLGLLRDFYGKRFESILTFGSFLDNIKRHQILVKLGITEHLKSENKLLDKKLEEHRLTKKKNDPSMIQIISATIAKSHVK